MITLLSLAIALMAATATMSQLFVNIECSVYTSYNTNQQLAKYISC